MQAYSSSVPMLLIGSGYEARGIAFLHFLREKLWLARKARKVVTIITHAQFGWGDARPTSFFAFRLSPTAIGASSYSWLKRMC